MTTTSTTTTVTTHTATTVADDISARFAAGEITTVNGRRVTSVWGRAAAVAWQNGTVSVTVEGRTKGKVGTVYAKPGQTLTTA